MSSTKHSSNSVKRHRLGRRWSQAELAQRAGVSRAAISAIEGERLVPSVATALALAHVLNCTVEELFQPAVATTSVDDWAWRGSDPSARYWLADIAGRKRRYPVEAGPSGDLPHDGCGAEPARGPYCDPEQTLVLAGCDPAAGLLARLYEAHTGGRMLLFVRSSGQALTLLSQGLVHVAGLHLGAMRREEGNAAAARTMLSGSSQLLSLVRWEDGVAVGSGSSADSLKSLRQSRVRWVGREVGSGARQCLDRILPEGQVIRRLARDHRGVAEAIRCGWADAGVCLKLTSVEAGLSFLNVQQESYDLCFAGESATDPRIQALIRVVRSKEFRRLYGQLPGYDTSQTGDLAVVKQ